MKGRLLLAELCAMLAAPASAAEPEINTALTVMGYGHAVKGGKKVSGTFLRVKKVPDTLFQA